LRTPRNGKTILLGEDDSEVRNYLEMALKCQGYGVEVARDGEEVISAFREHKTAISAVLLDIIMPRKDGLEVLREIRDVDTAIPVIMVSGASSPVNVVEAVKIGATDFLGKPVSHEDLGKAIQKALFVNGVPELPEAEEQPSHVFRGNNAQMQQIHALLGQIGWSEVPVLITGETGVGKEVIARELHNRSPRANKPFLKLNCAALPSELVESELFGYDRGAFTGAFQRKPGMFEMADQGTIMLDEIGDMDFKLQAKLLQVLQDQKFQRLGGKDTVSVDVRVVAATHRDLEQSIEQGTFREDLYYRLNVISLRLPPLRERSDEILPLANFLLRKHSPAGQAPPPIPPVLKQALIAHRWPGNIRELENLMRRFVILRDAETIANDLQSKAARSGSAARVPGSGNNGASGLPGINGHASVAAPASSADPILEQVAKAKHQAEAEAILAALNTTHWNRKKAAALLHIDYKGLLYKMKKLGIEDNFVSFLPGRANSASGEEKAITADQSES
jgi:two-component system response regulator AtoC